ncbi:NfeD family protein [Methylocapsa sp. S129]|uniref:NfeD family protein n=1 Tax=Methylocapsa sp. S129 TaxID=1641869 RepID=UPI00131ADFEC|nr:NfeD family protein [Methylocapsa sp. S129]
MSDIGLFSHGDYIVWLVAGFILCAAETIAPGAFLIWIGAAALILGAVEFVWPLEFTAQLFLFAALVVVLVIIGRRVYGSLDRRSAPQPLSRAHGLVGKEFFLDQPIERGFGNIRVDDSVWRVTGEDMGAGAKVRVTGVEEGSLLRVAKV